MSKYIFLCILLNFNIFFFPLSFFIYGYLKVRENEGHDMSDILSFCSLIFGCLCFAYIFSLPYSLYTIFSRKIEFLYRIKNPVIIIVFFGIFVFLLIVSIKLNIYVKNSYITINLNRQKNIEEKLSLVNQYLRYFNKELKEARSSNKEQINSIKNTIKLLEQIRDELEIIYTALDVNIVSESFKDVELASDSLNDIQKEIDKMQAYRSLSDISNDLEDLMKKYDKK